MSSHCEIRGDLTCSTMYHGGMQRSRLIPRRHLLFSKHIFMLKCNGVQNRNKSYIETNTLISDQSTIYSDTGNGMEQDPMQVLVNQWDIGEGRLRPRPAFK
ncbi:unnamed protein product [Rotaria sp. Silwood2]|nr:unnamed protein product [Rotaria sp. Silwood2]